MVDIRNLLAFSFSLQCKINVNMFLTATILTLQFFMSMPFVFFTIVLITVKKSLRPRSVQRPENPPGPSGYPLVGYLPSLRQDYHLQLTQLSKEYGPVYSFNLASKKAVVVSDYNLIREALKQPVFSGRPDTELTKLIGGKGKFCLLCVQSSLSFC